MIHMLFTGRRLLFTLLVVLGTILLCGLGVWQWNRHLQRTTLNQHITERIAQPPIALNSAIANPEMLDYRRVVAQGVYDSSQTILLRNRSHEGVTGYHVLTPLRLSDGSAVLVDRGWIPLTDGSPEARERYTVTGEVVVEGVARRSQEQTGPPVDPPLSPERPRLDAWFRVNTTRIQEQLDYPLLPVFIELQPMPGARPTSPQPSATTDLGLGSHLGYSIQWFSFAIILVSGYLVLTYRQSRSETV